MLGRDKNVGRNVGKRQKCWEENKNVRDKNRWEETKNVGKRQNVKQTKMLGRDKLVGVE